MNAEELHTTLAGYFKARIPFIAIRTTERSRVMEVITAVAKELKAPTFVHTLSEGIRDLQRNAIAVDERSIAGALEWAIQQLSTRNNLTVVLTEIEELDTDTTVARHVLDLVQFAVQKSGSLVVITDQPVWSRLQRQGFSLELGSPDEREMVSIIEDLLAPHRAAMRIEWDREDIERAASILAGITQIEAENVVMTLVAGGSITKADLTGLSRFKDHIFSDISGLERVALDQTPPVGGLSGLQRWLEKKQSLIMRDLSGRHMRPPRGVLLVGVPGCGKSLSAKAIASTWHLPLYRLDMASVLGQYVGQSEGRLKDALQTADHVAPCVLWIDEIEKGLAGSGTDSTGVTTRLVGQFLFWLQESRSRAFVVATANDVSALPPELLRKGRFDEMFFVDLPSPEERKQIIGIYRDRYCVAVVMDDALLDELVQLSDGFSGADLETAVREVAEDEELGGKATSPDFVRSAFRNTVSLMQTNPERIEALRAWGRDRAIPASGRPIAITIPGSQETRRMLLR